MALLSDDTQASVSSANSQFGISNGWPCLNCIAPSEVVVSSVNPVNPNSNGSSRRSKLRSFPVDLNKSYALASLMLNGPEMVLLRD